MVSIALRKAKQATSGLVFGKDVTLQTHGKDKYKRTLADLLLPEGTNVNHELVKDGGVVVSEVCAEDIVREKLAA